MNSQKKILIAAIIAITAIAILGRPELTDTTALPVTPLAPTLPEPAASAAGAIDTLLAQAFQQRRSNFLVTGSLPVSRLLPDDNDGSRHQKFILQTSTGQTVLVAHNIDLASRVPNLKVGDIIEFKGEYEWNEKGGVIHWTHHDPANRHAHGWLRHRGNTYQ